MQSKDNPSSVGGNNTSNKDEDEQMNEEEEDLEVVAAEEHQGYFERAINGDIEMMEDSSDQNNEESSVHVDPLQKQRELERRL